jgi:hypothetical protein
MTHKEIANRLREIIQGEGPHPYTKLELLADTLDPPRPEPGTVVWYKASEKDWAVGIAGEYFDTEIDRRIDVIYDGTPAPFMLSACKWKPARILADDEVAVKVPPVEEWTPNATAIGVYMSYGDSGVVKLRDVITRKEAKRMEAEQ